MVLGSVVVVVVGGVVVVVVGSIVVVVVGGIVVVVGGVVVVVVGGLVVVGGAAVAAGSLQVHSTALKLKCFKRVFRFMLVFVPPGFHKAQAEVPCRWLGYTGRKVEFCLTIERKVKICTPPMARIARSQLN